MKSLNWYRVVLSTEIEATDSEDAIRQANAECPGYIVESVRFIEAVSPTPTEETTQ